MATKNELEIYAEILNNPPKTGAVLTSIDGAPVVLQIQTTPGSPPFIFGRAYVSEIFGELLGWYLRGTNDEREIGWKCVLMTKARRSAVKECANQLGTGRILVKSLKIVRKSESGKSLLCEIGEYCTPEEIQPFIKEDEVAQGIVDALTE